MECWYKDCFHSSSRNECSFRVMPSNECQKKIWLRYASVTRLPKSKTPVICSCHFTETSENPIPYFESKRKAQLDDNDNLQPKVKHGKIINQETSLDRFQDSIEVVTNDIFEGERADEELGIENYLEDSGRIVNEHEAYCIEDCVENDINDINLSVCEVGFIEEVDETDRPVLLNEYCLLSYENNIVTFEEAAEPQDEAQTLSDEYEIEKMRKENEEMKLKICELESRSRTIQKLQKENAEIKSKFDSLSKENKKMKLQIEELGKESAGKSLSFDFAFIEHSNEKVFAYTGLPSKEIFYIVLNTMFKLEFKYVCGWNPVKVAMKNQLLMTLMKLRMDLRNFDLAERFNCSVATVSNIVRSWILAMHEIFFLQLMKDIPSRRQNLDSMPIVFKEFPECRIVLDCTEMFTDKPKKMNQQKSVFSAYKHHVTFKPLLGIAPNGVSTYASRFYPGSTSDKKIVEHCGITTRLHVGDSVLGDKGFLVKDVLPYGVNLNLPPFLTTPQFTREEVRRTEVIARARIHIERAINRVKNFRILKYIPSEMFFMASEVFQVCVALTNFQYPLVGEIAMRL